ncbi:FAD-dependent monooxygenase [Rhizobium sp. 18055]|uniref:FAD-dependent monooxygenase n=1 Tax=Rhizobium sp. 18055 TaxID=2681403 RepID=UPI0013578B45|nr:FAD-dependent monooxygenase [Rhizobium sp. 18055]
MPTSVLIAGAGPVGLTMAVELARFQVPVRIIDKTAARTDKSKALAVWSRTLELLDRSGCAQTLIAAGRKTRAVDIMDGKKTIARVAFDELDSPFRFVLMVPQSETERVLEEQLASYGVQVERNVEFSGFSEVGSGVSCNVKHSDGRTEVIDADWLVGCDGAHSPIRHQLGMSFDGETVPGNFVLADVHVAGLQIPEDEFPIFWHRSGIVAFFPIAKDRYRVIADVGAGSSADPTLADVQNIVDQRGPGDVVLSDCIWIAPFTVNERKVKDFRKGRVFLAGDAAHIHSPAGGQGMNTGMQDAFNLAWKLAMVIKNDASCDLLLDSYSVERSANAAQVLKDSGRMLRVGTMQNATGQVVRNFLMHQLFGLSFAKHIAAERLSELTVGYDESPLNGTVAKGIGFPEPGHRIGGSDNYGEGDSPQFAIIAKDNGDVRDRIKRNPGFVEGAIRTSPASKGICLVRPDGYVAMTASAEGWDDVDRYLDQMATTPAPQT